MSNLCRQNNDERQKLISHGRLAPYGFFLPSVDLAGNNLRLSVVDLAANGFIIAAEAKLKKEARQHEHETNIAGNLIACAPVTEGN